MGLIGNLVKAGIVVKVAQVAQRELSKPENRRKIKEGLTKLQQKATRPR